MECGGFRRPGVIFGPRWRLRHNTAFITVENVARHPMRHMDQFNRTEKQLSIVHTLRCRP